MAAVLLMTVLLLGATSVRGQGCEPYKKFPDHTMCIYREAACPGLKLMARGLTTAQKAEVVAAHNILRQAVVNGKVKGAPPATTLYRLTWDEELAEIAQRAADQCKFQHDAERSVSDSRYLVGQNVHIRSEWPIPKDRQPKLPESVSSWFNELFNPGFPSSAIEPFREVPGTGHYTQVVWADTKKVGCGYTMFEEKGFAKKLLFCNYGPAGNVLGDRVYEVRKPTG